MIVTVTCVATDAVYTLEVSPEIELENFKVLVQVESGSADMSSLVFFHNGRILVGGKTSLAELGVQDNDVLMFGPSPAGSMTTATNPPMVGRPISQANRPQQAPTPSGINWGSIQLPGASSAPQPPRQQRPDPDNPETIRTMLMNDARSLSLLKERNPRLANAINNRQEFQKILEQQRQERADAERERIRLLAADPFDVEAQCRIEEEIRMESVNQNMETAMEHTPEVFAEVYMLYVNVKVNGHPVKAFVDSGAQMTIMSQACAERCNIMRLVDHRWQGTAVGVGSQKIIGRVHMGQLQIEDNFLATSFTILEHQPMDILLGLDMLKRHQCCIDLKQNALIIGTTQTSTRFLNESELPECARLNRQRGEEANTSTEDAQLAQALQDSEKDGVK